MNRAEWKAGGSGQVFGRIDFQVAVKAEVADHGHSKGGVLFDESLEAGGSHCSRLWAWGRNPFGISLSAASKRAAQGEADRIMKRQRTQGPQRTTRRKTRNANGR